MNLLVQVEQTWNSFYCKLLTNYFWNLFFADFQKSFWSQFFFFCDPSRAEQTNHLLRLFTKLLSLPPSLSFISYFLFLPLSLSMDEKSSHFHVTLSSSRLRRRRRLSTIFKTLSNWKGGKRCWRRRVGCQTRHFERLFNVKNFFKWAILGLFFVYSLSFSNKQSQFLQQINVKNGHPVSELTTFWLWVSSFNH